MTPPCSKTCGNEARLRLCAKPQAMDPSTDYRLGVPYDSVRPPFPSTRGPVMLSRFLLLATAIALLPAPARAQAPKGTVRERLQAFVDSGDIAGAVAAVGTKGGQWPLEAVGKLSLDTAAHM